MLSNSLITIHEENILEEPNASIDFNQPLAKQAAIKELLNIPVELQIESLQLEHLLEIAKFLICNELHCCGYSENALAELQLKFFSPLESDQQIGEIYQFGWVNASHTQPEIQSQELPQLLEASASSENTPSVSTDFLGQLENTLNRESVNSNGSRLFSMLTRFRNSLPLVSGCATDSDGESYQAWFHINQNGQRIFAEWKPGKPVCMDIPQDWIPIM